MHIFRFSRGSQSLVVQSLNILHDSDVNMFADVIQARGKQIGIL